MYKDVALIIDVRSNGGHLSAAWNVARLLEAGLQRHHRWRPTTSRHGTTMARSWHAGRPAVSRHITELSRRWHIGLSISSRHYIWLASGWRATLAGSKPTISRQVTRAARRRHIKWKVVSRLYIMFFTGWHVSRVAGSSRSLQPVASRHYILMAWTWHHVSRHGDWLAGGWLVGSRRSEWRWPGRRTTWRCWWRTAADRISPHRWPDTERKMIFKAQTHNCFKSYFPDYQQ